MIADVRNCVTVDTIDAEVELEQVCNFLKEAGIRHWLSAGTFLGIYRDGKFLEGDSDIDIGIRGEDVGNIQSTIPWIMRPTIKLAKPCQSVFRSPRYIAIDLAWFWEDGDNIVNENRCGRLVKPKEKMNNLERIKFKGVEYPCPPKEWYVENRYKNWKKRMPKENHSWEYFAGGMLEV
jgi:hypothetical protein